jgi:hypothetical protein
MKFFWVIGLMGLFGLDAMAGGVPVIPSQTMSCEEAVAFFAKYKRIYTIAHGKNIVPIYGALPKHRWRELRCKVRQRPHQKVVNTNDSTYCVLGYYCGSR